MPKRKLFVNINSLSSWMCKLSPFTVFGQSLLPWNCNTITLYYHHSIDSMFMAILYLSTYAKELAQCNIYMTKCQSSWDQKPINLSIWRITPTKTIFYPTKLTHTQTLQRTNTSFIFMSMPYLFTRHNKVVKVRLCKLRRS